MLTEYRTITAADTEALIDERIRELELEHVRHRIRSMDAGSARESAELARIIADIERRLLVHLPPTMPDTDHPRDEPETPARTNGQADPHTATAAVSTGQPSPE